VQRIAERLGHPLDQLFRRGVLELLRLVVNAIPRIAKDLREVALEDAMAAQRSQRGTPAVDL
jgi:hypothetical protein